MNVLIVDDQPEVVESMVTGVNWKKIPVEQVFTAYSVKEAQSVFERAERYRAYAHPRRRSEVF